MTVKLRLMQPPEKIVHYQTYLQELLHYLKSGCDVSLTQDSQFAFAFLCDLFKVSAPLVHRGSSLLI